MTLDPWLTGSFNLSSGGTTDRYFDAARLLRSPSQRFKVAEAMYHIAEKYDLTSYCAVASGGIPWALLLADMDQIGIFWVNPSKQHGTPIRGYYEPGWKVVLIEDVVTTGKSVERATEMLKDVDIEVLKVIVVKDVWESLQ